MATIIPNAGAAGMSFGDNLGNIYASALREGLNQATQANMSRNTQLTNWLANLTNAQLGLIPDVNVKDWSEAQKADLTKQQNALRSVLEGVPAGTGALFPLGSPPDKKVEDITKLPGTNQTAPLTPPAPSAPGQQAPTTTTTTTPSKIKPQTGKQRK